MPWPFSRGRTKRSESTKSSNESHDAQSEFNTTDTNLNGSRGADVQPRRKRRRITRANNHANGLINGTRQPRIRTSLEDITALPSAPNNYNVIITQPQPQLIINSDLARPNLTPTKSAPINSSTLCVNTDQNELPRLTSQDDIRVKNGTNNAPRRVIGFENDLLEREVRTARRSFIGKPSSDKRGSTISLPLQDSIHSSMSGKIDHLAWILSGKALFSPRPDINSTLSYDQNALSSHPFKTIDEVDKVPQVDERTPKRYRGRVADLADTLSAAELHMAMEHDKKRKEKARNDELASLDAKLRRAEKLRVAETIASSPKKSPTAVHPALRERPEDHSPTKPVSHVPRVQNDERTTEKTETQQTSFYDSSTSTCDTPSPTITRNAAIASLPSPQSSPSAKPTSYIQMEDISNITSFPSPPMRNSVQDSTNRNSFRVRSPMLSPLITEVTSASAVKSASEKKSSPWTSIFKRSGSARSPLPSPPFTDTSFSNSVGESLPLHLTGGPIKRTGNSIRTQSIFKEDLPESPSNSQINSRVTSSDATTLSFLTGRINSNNTKPEDLTSATNTVYEGDESHVSTSNDHNDYRLSEGHEVPASRASIDTEGSWLSGKPLQRLSVQSQIRTSYLGPTQNDNHTTEPNIEATRPLTPSSEYGEDGIISNGLVRKDTTSRRRPTFVHQGGSTKSREALVLLAQAKPEHVDIDHDSPRNSISSSIQNEQDLEGQEEQQQDDRHDIEYGKGHEKHLSSGSAKLLDIPAKKYGWNSAGRAKEGRFSGLSGTSSGGNSDPFGM